MVLSVYDMMTHSRSYILHSLYTIGYERQIKMRKINENAFVARKKVLILFMNTTYLLILRHFFIDCMFRSAAKYKTYCVG